LVALPFAFIFAHSRHSSLGAYPRYHHEEAKDHGYYQKPDALDPAQLDWLLKRLGTDDKARLAEMMKSCTLEMTLTRGLPFAALVVGSMYMVRKRLPPQFHFGPKGWVFYSLLGVGSLTSANLLSMNKCTDKIRPVLGEMYSKYSLQDPQHQKGASSYEALRARNRESAGLGPHEGPPIGGGAFDPYQMPPPPTSGSSSSGRQQGSSYGDGGSTMSGTPYKDPYDTGSGGDQLPEQRRR